MAESSSSFMRSPIPRSRSDFNYVNLTPKEKRRTSDFSHLLPQFNRDPPYVRLLSTRAPIMEQPTTSKPVPTMEQPTTSNPVPTTSRMCRSSTGHNVMNSPALDVIRSQSMKSLRRSIDNSPSKHRMDESSIKDVHMHHFPVLPTTVIKEHGEDPSDTDLTRLRNFSMTSKGLVNWGDSFRSRSMPFVPAQACCSREMRMSTSHMAFRPGVPPASGSRLPSRHRIVIMGSSNVGKTTMIKQFRTSEYICAFDGSGSLDESNEGSITVVLNGEESDLEFVDSCSLEAEGDEESSDEAACASAKPYIPTADAYVVVYSVTNRRSFLHALQLVSRIQNIFLSSVVVLVGNKSDLVRIRAVTSEEGRTSAKEHNCSFLETSVAINHQVDELLVTTLTQIRSGGQRLGNHPHHAVAKLGSPHHCSFTRAKGMLKKFLKKACFQSKSCDNLQRL